MSDNELLVIDSDGLDEAQRSGNACAVCRKAWPRPDVLVGRLPDQRNVYTCGPCSSSVPTARAFVAAVNNALENTQPAALPPSAPDDRRVGRHRWQRRPLTP